jgi:hypothetical protein
VATSLEEFIDAGPWPQRAAMRVLVALARRPRARALLERIEGAEQLLTSVAAVGEYDRPEVARALGWDADAVVAGGRALRRAEGRP